jgi:hypothetical protein
MSEWPSLSHGRILPDTSRVGGARGADSYVQAQAKASRRRASSPPSDEPRSGKSVTNISQVEACHARWHLAVQGDACGPSGGPATPNPDAYQGRETLGVIRGCSLSNEVLTAAYGLKRFPGRCGTA